MGNAVKDFEYHAKAFGEIAVRNDLPFVLVAKVVEDGKTLRAAFGSIDDTIILLAIMLVQLHRQTGEPLDDLLAFFNLQVKFASKAYIDPPV